MRRLIQELRTLGTLMPDSGWSIADVDQLFRREFKTTETIFTRYDRHVVVRVVFANRAYAPISFHLPLGIFLRLEPRSKLAAALASSPELPNGTDPVVMKLLYDDELAWLRTAAIGARLILGSDGSHVRSEC